MKDRISVDIILKNDELFTEGIEEWFKSLNYFKPTHMRCKKLTKGRSRHANLEKFYASIENELQNAERSTMSLEDDINTISINKGSISSKIAWVSCDLDYDIYEENKDNIIKLIDKYMEKYDGIAAYACSLEDWFWQNNEDMQMYKFRGKSTKGVHTKKSELFPDDTIVDIEYNPGHSHNVNGIMFSSCWMMWYGPEFFNYIPRENIAAFNNCYEKKELENGCIRIKLYEDIWDYDKPENREKQISFREQMRIDDIAHMLMKISRDEAVDPSIEIKTGNFNHGGVRLINYYYNAAGERTNKSSANEIWTYELNLCGDVIWSENIKVNK